MSVRFSSVFLLSLIACDTGGEEFTVENQMLISTISAEEEGFVDHSVAEEGDTPESEKPLMFRTCDRGDFFEKLFEKYDANIDGELSEEEENSLKETRGNKRGKKGKRLKKLIRLLNWVYVVDGDGEISDTEKEQLFADFDERCENIHAKILEEFDADGDGELSDDEKETAKEAMKLRKEERKESKKEKKGEKKAKSWEDYLDFDFETLPGFAKKYDLDGDDELSESEMETFRTEMREKIISGKPFGKCNKDDDDSEEETEDLIVEEGEEEQTLGEEEETENETEER